TRTLRQLRFALVLPVCLLSATPTSATTDPGSVPEKATIVEHLDTEIDLSRSFVDQHGSSVPLSTFFASNRPVILTPVYYGCPNLCTFTLNGTTKLINELDLGLGTDYQVVSVSIDPTEGPLLASKKAKNYYGELQDSAAGEAGWHFLTGEESNIKALMNELGFVYEKDGSEYMHTAAIMVLTPAGKIARYFYGIKFPAEQVRLALVDASEGKIGTTLDKVFLYCFRFDPTKGVYTPIVMNIVRVVSLGTLAVLCGSLLMLRFKEKRGS
ncbi:MAG: SCO family protein, partial [Bdellovibrionales bacterium]|nr:SCO family protein [Bdellovibrionales bacterium]